MTNSVVTLTYSAVFILAVYLLWHFRGVAWYWHAASVVIALGIGLMPPQPGWQGPGFDLAVGAGFLFFFVWGAGFVVERLAHHTWHSIRPKHHA